MPKIKYVKETDNFLKIVQSSIKSSNNSWRVSFDSHKVMSHLKSLSDRQLGRVFSDPYWIRYPTWRYTGGGVSSATSRHAKRYGTVISGICRKASLENGRVFEIMKKKSVGLWSIYTIDNSSGKDKISLLKRVYQSKDSRVRLRAAKYLPVSYLPKMAKDSHTSVRNMVIRRLGIDNCAEMFLEDKNTWIRQGAIEASSIESIDYKSMIDKFRESSINMEPGKRATNWHTAEFENCIGTILRKIPKDQLPYFLDLADLATTQWHQHRIREVLKARISS